MTWQLRANIFHRSRNGKITMLHLHDIDRFVHCSVPERSYIQRLSHTYTRTYLTYQRGSLKNMAFTGNGLVTQVKAYT